MLLPDAESRFPRTLVIALHGWGETCRDFIRPFVPLRKRNIVVAAPQAPHPFQRKPLTKNVGFSWMTPYERDRAVVETNRYLDEFTRTILLRLPPTPDRIFLLGFSQGEPVAWRFALSGLRSLSGFIACSGDLPPDAACNLHKIPPFHVLATHGNEDKLVPYSIHDEAVVALQRHGYPVDSFEYTGGHEITPAVVEKIGNWIENQPVPKGTPASG